MKLPINPALACFAAAFLIGGCASTTTAPSTPPAATVRIQEWTAAYYGSAAAGKGTLYYNGQRHHFTISGLGAGGMGGQKVTATGKVYNLNNLRDFAGTYRGISGRATLAAFRIPDPVCKLSGASVIAHEVRVTPTLA